MFLSELLEKICQKEEHVNCIQVSIIQLLLISDLLICTRNIQVSLLAQEKQTRQTTQGRLLLASCKGHSKTHISQRQPAVSALPTWSGHVKLNMKHNTVTKTISLSVQTGDCSLYVSSVITGNPTSEM